MPLRNTFKVITEEEEFCFKSNDKYTLSIKYITRKVGEVVTKRIELRDMEKYQVWGIDADQLGDFIEKLKQIKEHYEDCDKDDLV